MKSIHIIAHSFPPATEAGAKSFMKFIYPLNRDKDFNVKIITAAPAMYAEHDNSFAGYMMDFEIDYVRWAGQRPFEILNDIFKWHTDAYILFAQKCKKILAHGERADLYFLRGQYFSTFLLAPFIRRHIDRPVVLYFSDPWLLNPYHAWTAGLKRRVAHFEAMALEAASGVIFTNTAAQKATLANYPNLRLHSIVLPHTYWNALYQTRNGQRHDRIRLTYAGNFYGDRQPLALFKAIAGLKKEKHPLMSHFLLRLIGPDEAIYRNQLRNLSLEQEVQFLGSKSYLETLRHLQESDVLVNVDAPSDLSLFLPSKLIDYLGCKLPIWSLSPSGPAASLVAEYGGVVSAPDDVEGIKRDLLICLERTHRQSWDLNLALAEQYESEKNYPRLKGFLQSILEENS